MDRLSIRMLGFALSIPPWLVCLFRDHEWETVWGSDRRDRPTDVDGTILAPDDNETICARCGKVRRKGRVGVR